MRQSPANDSRPVLRLRRELLHKLIENQPRGAAQLRDTVFEARNLRTVEAEASGKLLLAFVKTKAER